MLATKQLRTVFFILSAIFLSMAATTVLAEEETRTSTSVQSTKAERDSGSSGRLSRDEHKKLLTEGRRQSSQQSSSKQSSTSSELSPERSYATASTDFWFYSADVLLFNDHDVDGHYHGIDLLFDADTYYDAVEVYAVVYLSLDGGPWNEYSVTDNFWLFGSSADDEFNIVTELISGYPTGSYDLLIELFDGYSDEFLSSFGPVDTSELAFLPLEDANRDVPYVPPPTTVVVHEHGGAFGLPSILMLIAGAGLLRKLREKRA